jgi:molybdenum cofactor guanylyltransferase
MHYPVPVRNCGSAIDGCIWRCRLLCCFACAPHRLRPFIMAMTPERSAATPCPVEICILAGGLSRRMGRDKSRLKLGGRTLPGHIRHTAHLTGLPVRIIRRDIVPRCGPLGGVYTGLKTTRAGSVLFLACDMPFVTRELLAWAMRGFDPDEHARFVQSETGAGFPFLLRRSALAGVWRQIERRQFSLRKLASALKARLVFAPRRFAAQLQNVNTPAEWKRARERWRNAAGKKSVASRARRPLTPPSPRRRPSSA